MNEEREIPRIESAPILHHKVADPRTNTEKAEVPASVEQARAFNAEAARAIIAERLKELDKELEQPKNFFELLKENAMTGIFTVVWNFLQRNWKTTVAGALAFIVPVLAKWGIQIDDTTVANLTFLFTVPIFAVAQWDVRMVVGFGLLVLSFLINPILGAVGITLDAGMLILVKQGIDFVIGAILKDQKATFSPPSTATAAAALLLIFLHCTNLNTASAQVLPQVPSSFQVFNSTIQVRYDSLECERKGAWGIYNNRKNHILLNIADHPHQNVIHSTFYHELTHCLLEKIERNDLSRNEKFVSLFSRALYQSLSTMRYDTTRFK